MNSPLSMKFCVRKEEEELRSNINNQLQVHENKTADVRKLENKAHGN